MCTAARLIAPRALSRSVGAATGGGATGSSSSPPHAARVRGLRAAQVNSLRLMLVSWLYVVSRQTTWRGLSGTCMKPQAGTPLEKTSRGQKIVSLCCRTTDGSPTVVGPLVARGLLDRPLFRL